MELLWSFISVMLTTTLIGLTIVSRPRLCRRSGGIRGCRTGHEGPERVQSQGTITLSQAFSKGPIPPDVARKRHDLSCMDGSLTENMPVSGVAEWLEE